MTAPVTTPSTPLSTPGSTNPDRDANTHNGAAAAATTPAPTATAAPTPDASSAIATTSLTYAALTDVDRQLAYAMRYWKDYNLAEYGTMNPIAVLAAEWRTSDRSRRLT